MVIAIIDNKSIVDGYYLVIHCGTSDSDLEIVAEAVLPDGSRVWRVHSPLMLPMFAHSTLAFETFPLGTWMTWMCSWV